MTENKLNEDELAKDLTNEENQAADTPNPEASAEGEEVTNAENTQLAEAGDPLEEAQKEITELKDKYLRLYAEFENFRRRTAKEKLELVSTANAGLLKSLLPVVDDFERAISSFEALQTPEMESFKEGMGLIYSKLIRTLENEGLQAMDIQNADFNSDFHESVAQFPAPSEEQKGKIVEVLEKGYFLKDKVIRYAKVVVGV